MKRSLHEVGEALVRRLVLVCAAALVLAACAPETSDAIGGETQWIDVAGGKLKTQVFEHVGDGRRPILVLVLHGDLPNPPPDYQYLFAKLLVAGISEATGRSAALRAALGPRWERKSIVAAGILRPGYADPSGDRSSGEMGKAVADNYTPEVVDAVAAAARELKAKYDASAVVLVGHSGGGAIAANVLGRHPDVASYALLVACGCDPEAWRARMRARQPDPVWDEPISSLMPLSLVDGIARDTRVRLLAGENDDVVLPADIARYAVALRARDIEVRLTVAPGLGHNILMSPEAFRELSLLVGALGDAE
ncbi:MAG TPA: alpha/beta fold hydrolase [Gammaproteobacteria bacterium]|nr:alpha/beta fold hydrolase [Gammaproteobacteria bacterium]